MRALGRRSLFDTMTKNGPYVAINKVARQLLTSKEIARIWERGEYDENEQACVLPCIRLRPSYAAGNPCKLPLLGPPSEGIDGDTISLTSGGAAVGSTYKGKRVYERRGRGDTKRDHNGTATESGGGIRGNLMSTKSAGGEEGNGRRRGIPGNVEVEVTMAIHNAQEMSCWRRKEMSVRII